MTNNKWSHLLAIEKTKRKTNYKCSRCKIDIIVGSKYMNVIYNDTFIRKPFGAFHIDCWQEFLTDK